MPPHSRHHQRRDALIEKCLRRGLLASLAGFGAGVAVMGLEHPHDKYMIGASVCLLAYGSWLMISAARRLGRTSKRRE